MLAPRNLLDYWEPTCNIHRTYLFLKGDHAIFFFFWFIFFYLCFHTVLPLPFKLFSLCIYFLVHAIYYSILFPFSSLFSHYTFLSHFFSQYSCLPNLLFPIAELLFFSNSCFRVSEFVASAHHEYYFHAFFKSYIHV